MTQLEAANKSEVTPQMEKAADREPVSAGKICQLIREGRVVVPVNPNHVNLEPIGIGENLHTKVNANIGTSPDRKSVESELQKLDVSLEAGTDAVMDLSTGGDITSVRRTIIEHCPVPVGTVPIYQAAIESGGVAEMTAESFMRTLREHGENGVDFVTIHAGVQREAIPLARKRGMGVVSRGGSFMVRWMETKGQESFLYENFDEILGIAGEHGMTLSLGDGLRPGCIGDATDDAQLHELHVLGELAERAVKAEVQVMIEGPGHVPLNDIERNVQLEKDICGGAPFYVLGPLPTDIAPGYDHIVGSIGGAIAASAGADFLCYLTPKEHVGLPDARDVREGVVVTRIAAHIGDITKGISGAEELDRKMSEARTGRDWDEMARHALDSVQFQRLLSAEDRGDQCSMCGEYCALKIFSGDDAR